ncbi:MAG: hypothetical protein IH586_12905, partial [Anaerolineaceae bacterium]|nr:hypothetical protein [Anaerolineaceae bacterium]
MMETQVSPLVLTKLRAPAMRPRSIPRKRLVDLLTSEKRSNFILVCAPAGYGKTTLLAEWTQSLIKNGAAVAWYALDASDDDSLTFASYLTSAFIQAFGPIPELIQVTQLLRASLEIDFQRILPILINTIISSRLACTLILDDYHLITSPAIHSAMAYLLDHLPHNLCIAIGSRSDPPLRLARMRVRGQVLEIRANDLRFNLDETAAFLNEFMRLGLSSEGVTEIEERTEGWVAGLQLAALAMQIPFSPSGRAGKARSDTWENFISSFTGTHRYLGEYLMEEVVNCQSEDVQSFLFSTSILDRMCAPLCDALLGAALPGNQSSSETMLQQLEKANLFIVAMDEQGGWYRYHHLFRDFLQTRLNKTRPEQVNALHRAASEWLAEHTLLREAANHAFQTHEWEYAAAFVEQHSFTLILHSEISTIYEWCSAFPEEVIQRHPMLSLMEGLALAYRFRRQNRARVEIRLQQVDRAIAALGENHLARELAEFAAVVSTFLSMAPDPAAALQEQLALSQRMLKQYPTGDPGQFSGLLTSGYAYMALHNAQASEQALEAARQSALRGRLYFGIVESTFHLARLAHSQGQLRRSVEICRQGQADIATMLTHPEQELPALGCLDIALGCVLLEKNQLEEAEQHLHDGLELMGGGMNPYYLMTAYLALFRLYEILGSPNEAEKNLDRLESAWPDIAFCINGLRVVHSLRIEPDDPAALAQAVQWSEEFSPGEGMLPPGMGPLGAADVYYQANLAWNRVQIACGNLQAARSNLDRQLSLASTHQQITRLIELALLEAELEAKTEKVPAYSQPVRAALERALTLAQPEGFIRIFDQNPGLTRILRHAANHEFSQDYLARILAAIEVPNNLDLAHPGTGFSIQARSSQLPV